jgi:hypothetical protein
MTGTRAQLRDFLLQWFGDYFPGSPFLCVITKGLCRSNYRATLS